ncbi:hypothetical protein AB0J86_33105 [Micromonospora sp. NPDC049559]|uniref:hypothetical protein n=1 Tax=Micromonospora sp. NPDC049559 TaxID=3155923 RepID=UPI00343B83CA
MTGLAAQDQPAPDRIRLPAGGQEFFALLARLLRRPRRTDRRLPLFWLVRSGDAADVTTLLRRAATQGHRRRVPHVLIDVAAQPENDVPTTLRAIYRQLSLEAFGGERLRFRHYPLADWLMHQSLVYGLDLDDSRAALVRRLRDRHGPRPATDPLAATAGGGGGDMVATASQFLLWLVRRAIPSVLFRAAISGRIPLLGRHYRWFMRQQYLAPRQSATFLGFAERLTAGWRDGEQPEQVNKLLLHAFLEDLRQAYRRPPWRLAGWRRTAYPMLVLANVAPGDAGHTIVRLLGDVRNETGRNDPLLVVAVGDTAPPELPQSRPLTDADEAYDEWADVLPETRRLRRPGAWLIVLGLDGPVAGPQPRGGPVGFVAPDPPWWARRVLAVALALVLVATGALWVGARWGVGCHPRPFAGRISVELVDGECIGYSDSAAHVFNPGQPRLRSVQERIFQQNAAAEKEWEASERRRPYLTLVYFGTLTGTLTGPGEESYVSEREELEGMAAVQYALLKESAGAEGAALLRVVVANGGRQMRYATRTVRMLAELARDDPTLLGVVGLVDSRRATVDALRDLNRIGLPALAPTLSADGIDQQSKLYLQMSAPNADQATLVAEYARKVLRVGEAHVYYTTGEGSSRADDLYVDTLVDALRQRFGDGLAPPQPWQTGGHLTQECGYPGLLFFAGRWSEFDGFLRELEKCGANPPRHLLADDSVNRYMANPGLRATAPGNIPLTYVSKASLATCAALARASAAGDNGRGSFLNWIRAADLLDPPRCVDGTAPPVGERVSLAYDAAMMVVRAVESLAARLRHASPQQPWEPRAVNPVGVHAEVLRQNAGQGYPGVSGLIRFPPDSGRPEAKRIALMRVERIPDVAGEVREVYHCGRADDPAGPAGCGG